MVSFARAKRSIRKTLLKDLEEAGEVAGVEFIRALPKSLDKTRGGPTRQQSAILSGTSGNNLTQGPVGFWNRVDGGDGVGDEGAGLVGSE